MFTLKRLPLKRLTFEIAVTLGIFIAIMIAVQLVAQAFGYDVSEQKTMPLDTENPIESQDAQGVRRNMGACRMFTPGIEVVPF